MLTSVPSDTNITPADAVCDLLRRADRMIAAAARIVAASGLNNAAGLPTHLVLQMDGRQTGWEARGFVRAATVLASMPRAAAAQDQGLLSWSQIRAITRAVARCDRDGRAAADQLIGARAAASVNADPDEIVTAVEDLVAAHRRDSTRRAEQRAIERSFLAVQPTLDGRASIYGEGDAESIATIVDALDRHAGPPDAASTRAQQRYAALLAIAESTLSGRNGGHHRRPRPRILATIDIETLAGSERDAAARILWALNGRPPRLSPVGTQTLLCDADVGLVVFRKGRPIAIGDPASPVPAAIRRAVAARDQGCRFPGCNAPLAWADVHHIRARARGGRSDPDNLVTLCRRCHRRAHLRGWTITVEPGGSVTFRHRGRRYDSPPRIGPPARE